jgi:hypothetical protein
VQFLKLAFAWKFHLVAATGVQPRADVEERVQREPQEPPACHITTGSKLMTLSNALQRLPFGLLFISVGEEDDLLVLRENQTKRPLDAI